MQLILDTVPVLREEDRQDLLQVTPQWLLPVICLLADCLNMEQGVVVMFCLQLSSKNRFSLQTRLNVYTTLSNKAPSCVLYLLYSRN